MKRSNSYLVSAALVLAAVMPASAQEPTKVAVAAVTEQPDSTTPVAVDTAKKVKAPRFAPQPIAEGRRRSLQRLQAQLGRCIYPAVSVPEPQQHRKREAGYYRGCYN